MGQINALSLRRNHHAVHPQHRPLRRDDDGYMRLVTRSNELVVGLQQVTAPAQRRPRLAGYQSFAIRIGRVRLHQRLLLNEQPLSRFQMRRLDGIERQVQVTESRRNDVLHVVEHRDSLAMRDLKKWLKARDRLTHEVSANANGERSKKIGDAESILGIKRPPEIFWVEMAEVR